jgi:GST-like protein
VQAAAHEQRYTRRMKNWLVLGCKGCGSTIVEAALTLANIPYDREEADYSTPSGRDRLLQFNPLAQVPTVILPDGTVMTESLALLLHINDLVPALGLLPAAGDPARPTALRHLAFLIAAVYPTFTYGDEPAKWVGDAGPALKESTLAHRKRLYAHLESIAGAPHFLGERFSAIDLYVAVMTRWQPGRAWFAQNTPKLHAISTRLDADPRLRAVWAANFDG